MEKKNVGKNEIEYCTASYFLIFLLLFLLIFVFRIVFYLCYILSFISFIDCYYYTSYVRRFIDLFIVFIDSCWSSLISLDSTKASLCSIQNA